jgi:hypothetical protein
VIRLVRSIRWMRWDRLPKNQPAEITMFQISEVQEAPAFNGRRSFLTLRRSGSVLPVRIFKLLPNILPDKRWPIFRPQHSNASQLNTVQRDWRDGEMNVRRELPLIPVRS